MHSLRLGIIQNEARSLVIFDRDGTLNIDNGYTFKAEELELTIFAKSIKSLFQEYKFAAAIASNQSGIARGFFTLTDFNVFTMTLIREIDPFYRNFFLAIACPHLPSQNCHCRKPKSAMIEKIMTESWFKNVLMVGNSNSDMQAATNAGISYLDCTEDNSIESFKEWVEVNCDCK